MKHTVYWALEVHYWPVAAEAGVAPVKSTFGEILSRNGESNAALYQPHSFHFVHPPQFECFINACKQLPWTHVWEDTLLPVLQSNDWPMIDDMHKRASVELHDADGRHVGKLVVSKCVMFNNSPSPVYPVLYSERQRVIRYLKGNRERGENILRDPVNENKLMMLFVERQADTEEKRVAIMRQFVKEQLAKELVA